MEPDLEPPNSTTTTTAITTANHRHSPSLDNNNDDDYDHFYIDESSNCSTPYVSAPSSPGRLFPAAVGFFYSAPASPMHYVLAAAAAAAPVRSSAASAVALAPAISDASSSGSFEFEFSARFDSPAPEIGPPPMSSADELFLNGQIRPMKLSAHLQRPQTLAPLIDLGGEEERENEFEDEDEDVFQRGRDLRFRSRSQRRRTRSLSPLRSTAPFDWFYSDDMVSTTAAAEKKDDTAEERENNGGDNGGGQKEERENESEATPLGSASSSRCSSAGRSSKRWVFLKDFLRSKSEGRSNNKFWQNISFSPAKERKERESAAFLTAEKEKMRMRKKSPPSTAASTAASAAAKRRSAHEMHYTANRAQSEEMRRKTFLPYRQGLLGCLGFNSKSYGAINGFARALNPVSSR